MTVQVQQMTVMAGKLGDVFWDLSPWIVYAPGFDLGCSVYVANNTAVAREYALMARLTRDTTVISEEALPVFGYTWFTVDPGDFIELHGALRFTETGADITVLLMERATGEAADMVATRLVAPAGAAATPALPPAWPGTTTPGTTDTTWTSMFGTMLPVMMLAMFGLVIVSAFKPKEEKLLPLGRER